MTRSSWCSRIGRLNVPADYQFPLHIANLSWLSLDLSICGRDCVSWRFLKPRCLLRHPNTSRKANSDPYSPYSGQWQCLWLILVTYDIPTIPFFPSHVTVFCTGDRPAFCSDKAIECADDISTSLPPPPYCFLSLIHWQSKCLAVFSWQRKHNITGVVTFNCSQLLASCS